MAMKNSPLIERVTVTATSQTTTAGGDEGVTLIFDRGADTGQITVLRKQVKDIGIDGSTLMITTQKAHVAFDFDSVGRAIAVMQFLQVQPESHAPHAEHGVPSEANEHDHPVEALKAKTKVVQFVSDLTEDEDVLFVLYDDGSLWCRSGSMQTWTQQELPK